MKISELPKFDKNQLLTIAGMLLMVVITVCFNVNVGLISFLIAILLILIGVGNEKECIRAIPWNTLMLVCGIGVLMNVVIEAGGIGLLARTLASIMTPRTAPALLALSSGIMSWFSSTSGVVMPTMIPTIPTIMESMSALGGTIPGAMLVSAVVCGSSPAGISPASTGGALVMAAISEDESITAAESNRLFMKLFLMSMFEVFMAVLCIFLGGMSFTPYG